MKIWIPGEFTTKNEYIKAERANRFAAAKIKKYETERVRWECRTQGIQPISVYPVTIILTWVRMDKKSDPDNIADAVKYILDGLQEAGVLKQDTWKCVRFIGHEWAVSKIAPGVMVEIKP